MNESRRDLLRKVSALPALTIGLSGIASAADCSSYPKWGSETAYEGGDKIVYDDTLWKAEWWTRGTEPAENANAWTKVGDCGSDSGGGGDGNTAPSASFTASPTSPAPGESVMFDASGSADADGSISSYEWDFTGNGTIDASGQTVTHTFSSEGSHTVELTVTDDADATDTTTADVIVGNQDSETVASDTTIEEFLPNYEERYIPDIFLDFMIGDGGSANPDEPVGNLSDADKAARYEVDLDAIRNNVEDGSLKFGSIGTQALDWVNQFELKDFPNHASAQLLPRLIILPDVTESPTFQGSGRSVAWEQTAGPTAASNDPLVFYQDEWPTDARGEKDAEVAERDRVYLQAQNNPDEWMSHGNLPDSILKNYDNQLLDTIKNNVHPVTGNSLGGESFTATAPMEARAEIHSDGWYGYQVLLFKNTSPLPYHLDATVIWWIGPSNYGKSMSAGHYNNEQRPPGGHGHPQRDIIEVMLDDAHMPAEYAGTDVDLSAFAIRLAFHDSPYNMRTAYPNQWWSLEVSTGNDLNGRHPGAEERQKLLDLMVDTVHVELETDMDLNDDVVDAIELKNRMGN